MNKRESFAKTEKVRSLAPPPSRRGHSTTPLPFPNLKLDPDPGRFGHFRHTVCGGIEYFDFLVEAHPPLELCYRALYHEHRS